MRGRKVRREGERAIGGRTRFRIRLLRGRAPEEIPAEFGPGARQPAPGERIARVEQRRLRVVLDRLTKISFRFAAEIEPSLQQGVVGFEAPTRGAITLR